MYGASEAPITLLCRIGAETALTYLGKTDPCTLTVIHEKDGFRATVTLLHSCKDSELRFTRIIKDKLPTHINSQWHNFFESKIACVVALTAYLRKLSKHIAEADHLSQAFFGALILLLEKHCIPNLAASSPKQPTIIDALIAVAFKTSTAHCLRFPPEEKSFLTAFLQSQSAEIVSPSALSATGTPCRRRAPSLPGFTERDEEGADDADIAPATLRSFSTASIDGDEPSSGTPALLFPAAAAAAAAAIA